MRETWPSPSSKELCSLKYTWRHFTDFHQWDLEAEVTCKAASTETNRVDQGLLRIQQSLGRWLWPMLWWWAESWLRARRALWVGRRHEEQQRLSLLLTHSSQSLHCQVCSRNWNVCADCLPKAILFSWQQHWSLCFHSWFEWNWSHIQEWQEGQGRTPGSVDWSRIVTKKSSPPPSCTFCPSQSTRSVYSPLPK